ncbi:DUF1499 domain-containing protein [Roseibium sp. HPY-6]|uniref:DUF1499 domain-containing protein n=1 Tax=Roseibium sp. HPY-6 TaxID=3229852 RepID=UPI00338FA3DB
MKILALAVVVLLLVAVVVAVYIRFAPVKSADVSLLPSNAPGDYALPGGFYAVRPLEAVDPVALEAQIAATVRTKKVSGSARDLPMIFIHRSLVWGFPDVTHVWVDADNLHVHSHLVFGKSDLGVNRERMQSWFASLGL